MGGLGFGESVGKGANQPSEVTVKHEGRVTISVDDGDSKDNRTMKEILKDRIRNRERKFKTDEY